MHMCTSINMNPLSLLKWTFTMIFLFLNSNITHDLPTSWPAPLPGGAGERDMEANTEMQVGACKGIQEKCNTIYILISKHLIKLFIGHWGCSVAYTYSGLMVSRSLSSGGSPPSAFRLPAMALTCHVPRPPRIVSFSNRFHILGTRLTVSYLLTHKSCLGTSSPCSHTYMDYS